MSRGRPQPSRHPSKTPSVSPFAFADCSAVSPERCFSCLDLKEVAERPEVQVQISVLEPEMRLQLLHAPVEPHERFAEPVDLVLAQVPLLHPGQRLSLHELAQELDQREHELREAALDLLGIGVHAPREGAARLTDVARDAVQVAVACQELVERVRRSAHSRSPFCETKLYGGHGPVQTKASSPREDSSCPSSARKDSTRLSGTRYAASTSSWGVCPGRRELARASRASGSWISLANRSSSDLSARRAHMYSVPSHASVSARSGAST